MQANTLSLVIENVVNPAKSSIFAQLQAIYNDIIEMLESKDRSVIMAAISQKGGVAKSTIIYQFAVMLANLGFKVRIFDCDTQQTLQHQWKKRYEYKKQEMAFIKQAKEELAKKVAEGKLNEYFRINSEKSIAKREERLKAISSIDFANHNPEVDFSEVIKTSADFDVVLFDTACHLSDAQSPLLYVCDSIVIPFNNSDDEFDTNVRVKKFIQDEKVNAAENDEVITADIRSVIIDRPNTAKDRTEYVKNLWIDYGYQKTHGLLESRLTNRQIYRDVKNFGLGVGELEGQAGEIASLEIATLFKELLVSSDAKQAKRVKA
ncbi:AAA family ATPase [Pseudomonas sp. xss_4]|uniref:AAA family ATPase n=1 Tax=Pseudomonas sp. xss_4 TaxID=3367216 RepID=UPI00370B78DB